MITMCQIAAGVEETLGAVGSRSSSKRKTQNLTISAIFRYFFSIQIPTIPNANISHPLVNNSR